MPLRLIPLLFLLLATTGCPAAGVKPVTATPQFVPEADEKVLWKKVEEEEDRLDRSGWLYEKADAVNYVNQVAQRLAHREMQGTGLVFQIRIIKNPLLNAFTYPNGIIYVHTGILARMENEAQLATLLGHEMTHATHRHALQTQRSVKNTSTFLAGLQVLMAPFGTLGQIASLLGSVGGIAAVTGYTRDLEEEADTQGLELMAAAGYDPREAPKLFEFLKKDLEEQKISEPFFFGTHPRLQERVESYRKLLETQYAGRTGENGSDRFTSHTRSMVIDNAALNLTRGRFEVAERSLQDMLQREPGNGMANNMLGEVYRQRAKEGDLDRAKQQFILAIQADPTSAEPRRGLGLVLYKQGSGKEAAVELQKYLALSPQAPDKPYVERYIKELKSQGRIE